MKAEQLLAATIAAHKHNLRGSALAALLMVRKEPCPLATVAKRIGISSSALTGLADQLYLAGYAIRTTTELDRRKQFLSITEKGKETLQCILTQ